MSVEDEALPLWRRRLNTADARRATAEAELTAAADERAIAIDEEVDRRGRGGAVEVAAELGVSLPVITKARARAREARTGQRWQGLPPDAFEQLLVAEAAELAPLTALQWQVLNAIVRSTFIDEVWIGQPGTLLSYEVDEAADELPAEADPPALAAACRSWSRAQGLAVIDACQRGQVDSLPTAP